MASGKCPKGGWHDWYEVWIEDGNWEGKCRKCGMRRKEGKREGDNTVKQYCSAV